MIKTQAKKNELHRRRRLRGKKKLDRYSGIPRLVVFRSARHITGQLVDARVGHTLVSASRVEKALIAEVRAGANKTDVATRMGLVLGRRAVEKKITRVVFDRNGRPYRGRSKAFAEGARKSGLKF